MPRTSHVLKDNTPEQLHLIAVSSHEPDYRVSWLVNSSLKIQLRKTSDHIVPVSAGTENETGFSCYGYSDQDALLEYFLVSNHSENGYLLPKYKNIDYFLYIAGEVPADFLKNIIARLKTTPGIITAFELVLTEPRFVRLFQFR
ncbi:MAG: IPExxxVDY family protein [Bacteroidales bacterium]|jgi:hypothetical protein|nr:IPExxxVDY family protein [Bacteroidales bacterium]